MSDDEFQSRSMSMARIPVRNQQKTKKQPTDLMANRALLPALFFGGQLLRTSTSYTFTTSTITSTNVITCIASASFYGGSTQACRRKRSGRSTEVETIEDPMSFNPSAVLR